MSAAGRGGDVALVTGANHGIGAATAVELARHGSAVLCTYWRVDDEPDPAAPDVYRRRRQSTGEDVASAVRAVGGQVAVVEADLRDPTVPTALFDAAEEQLGPVNILINNATGWVADTFTSTNRPDRFGRTLRRVTAETWREVFRVDAMGAALLIAEFARRHVERSADWGRIVGLTSGGDAGFPQEVTYGAAKAALVNYTMSAATELAPYGVTANVIHPPVTDTGWVTDAVRESVAASPTHVHIAAPAEVAAVIRYLTSREAHLVTGNVIALR